MNGSCRYVPTLFLLHKCLDYDFNEKVLGCGLSSERRQTFVQ